MLTKADAVALTKVQRTSTSNDPPEEKIDDLEHRAPFNSSRYPVIIRNEG